MGEDTPIMHSFLVMLQLCNLVDLEAKYMWVVLICALCNLGSIYSFDKAISAFHKLIVQASTTTWVI